MKFENIRVMNFENALRGMRNPKESYHLIDSKFGLDNYEWADLDYEMTGIWLDYLGIDEKDKSRDEVFEKVNQWLIKNGVLYEKGDFFEYAFIGPNDMKLAQTLIKAGPEHRKFMRQIMVSVDITAPLYWWKEFDTYKVGTVANSTSTMHKMAAKPITIDCFETDDYQEDLGNYFDGAVNIPGRDGGYLAEDVQFIIDLLENLRQTYLETKDVRYWKELIRWLPESWLQTRTVTMSYENLLAMCSKGQRRFHKLNEWSGKHTEVEECFINFARKLPYSQELIFLDELDTEKLPVVDF